MKERDFIEIEDFCLSKYTIKREKISHRQGEDIHNNMFDKRFVLRLYKETTNHEEKVKQFNFKMGKRLAKSLHVRGYSNGQ